jgi:hypothetical protein
MIRCWFFHRAYWVVIYRNPYGGTKKCAICGRKHHYGGL